MRAVRFIVFQTIGLGALIFAAGPFVTSCASRAEIKADSRMRSEALQKCKDLFGTEATIRTISGIEPNTKALVCAKHYSRSDPMLVGRYVKLAKQHPIRIDSTSMGFQSKCPGKFRVGSVEFSSNKDLTVDWECYSSAIETLKCDSDPQSCNVEKCLPGSHYIENVAKVARGR